MTGSVKSMLRHATGHVGVMVLHCDAGQPAACPIEGVTGRGIIRVQIVGDDFGSNREQLLVKLDVALERPRKASK